MKKIVSLLLMVSFLFPASKEEELQQKVNDVKEKLQKEKDFFQKYQERRSKLLDSKKEEIVGLQSDLNKAKAELSRVKTDIQRDEIIVKNAELEEKDIKGKLREMALSLKGEVLQSIPYNQQRRASILTSIISDIDAGVGSSMEILNRLIAFFDEEEILSYDSQVFSAILPIAGKDVNVTVIRVGRVLFFVDDGREVYPYIQKDTGEYVVDDKNPLSLPRKTEVRDAISMLRGQKPLDVVNLRVIMGGKVAPEVKK